MSLAVAPLALSGEDRAELERLARSGDRRLQERAGIVLACAVSAEGNSGVAAELGLSVETVRKWRSRFTVSGTAGLADARRPGRRKADLVLTGAERDQLARWARRGKTSQVLALRAKIVLACAEGSENKAVAAELRTSEHNVARWRGRFIAGRLGGLHDEKRPGRPLSILLDQVEEVVTATLEELPRDATHWSRASMARRSGLSESTVGRIWRKFDLKPHLIDGFKLSTDPLFVEKVVDVVGLYHNPPDKAVVLCVDEKSQVQALDRSQPVLPMMPGMPERRTHDYARHGVTSLFAAFDIADGTVISETAPPPPPPGVPEVPEEDRQERPGWPGRPPGLRQLRNAQDPGHPGLARPPSPLPRPLHPDRVKLDQPGGTLVRLPDRQEDPPRRPQVGPGPGSRHPRLDRAVEREPPPLRLDEDRRRDP